MTALKNFTAASASSSVILRRCLRASKKLQIPSLGTVFRALRMISLRRSVANISVTEGLSVARLRSIGMIVARRGGTDTTSPSGRIRKFKLIEWLMIGTGKGIGLRSMDHDSTSERG